jgi:hypothetical protein
MRRRTASSRSHPSFCDPHVTLTSSFMMTDGVLANYRVKSSASQMATFPELVTHWTLSEKTIDFVISRILEYGFFV